MTREDALKVIRGEIDLCEEESVDALELEDVYSFVEHSITLDRIKEAIDQIGELDSERIEFHEGTNRLGTNEFVCVDEVLEILNKLIAEVEGEHGKID